MVLGVEITRCQWRGNCARMEEGGDLSMHNIKILCLLYER